MQIFLFSQDGCCTFTFHPTLRAPLLYPFLTALYVVITAPACRAHCPASPVESARSAAIDFRPIRRLAPAWMGRWFCGPGRSGRLIARQRSVDWLEQGERGRKQESGKESGKPYGETYVLPLDALLGDVLARRREQRGPAPFIHGILHERLDGRDAHLAQRPVRVHGLR